MPCLPTCQCPRAPEADEESDPVLCGRPTNGKTVLIEGYEIPTCDECAAEIQADPEGALVLDLLYGTPRPPTN